MKIQQSHNHYRSLSCPGPGSPLAGVSNVDSIFLFLSKRKLPFLLLFLLLAYFTTQAQKHANFWYLGDKGLDFNVSPPRILTDGAMKVWEGSATISDSKGNLLFYSNGETIWNKNHTVMVNGSGLTGHFSSRNGVIIVPQTGSNTHYYVFTTDANERRLDQGLRYSLVDMSRQRGLGEVIQKNILLQPLAVEKLTATGSCSCPGTGNYWLAADRLDQPGFLFAYQISESGVSHTPVISNLPGVSNFTYLKFSPQGNKIAFTGHDTSNKPIIGIATFNQTNGRFSDVILIPNIYNSLGIEFSGNGRFLYSTSSFSTTSLMQFDLSGQTAQEIQNSAIQLADASHPSMFTLQLAPDGNLYYASTSLELNKQVLYVMKNVNTTYTAATFKPELLTDLTVFTTAMPNFVTSFLYHNDTLTLNLDAGPDRRVCRNEATQLGGKSSPSIRYSWSPSAFLSDSTAPNPTFRYTASLARDTTLQYILTASEGNCARRDTVLLTIPYVTEVSLSGSRSVCPGVEGVSYQVTQQDRQTYRWQVSGGTIGSGQGTAAITVDWGSTNAGAWVEVVPVDEYGCEGTPHRLPVHINVLLETEKPQGPEEICLNLRQGNHYQVNYTNGSIYTWGVKGGTITLGQGTDKVTVDWSGEGLHRLWVQEQSTTRDTVCFGTSDTLFVRLYQDKTALNIHYASVSTTNERQVEIFWSSTDPDRLSAPLTLYRREQGIATWQEAFSVAAQATTATDTALQTDERVYEYLVEGLNGCGELIQSKVHNTVRLSVQTNEENGQLLLSWNPYISWPQGVERYEVWRQLDEQPGLVQVGIVQGDVLSYNELSSLDGFRHRLRIRAVARGSEWTSWSNELVLNFTHKITAPNIFTPNGDGLNDTFIIPQIGLYPDNRLTVFNRWGKQVYSTRDYRNNWTAEGLSAGTYFYHVELLRTGAQFKGWVEIVR